MPRARQFGPPTLLLLDLYQHGKIVFSDVIHRQFLFFTMERTCLPRRDLVASQEGTGMDHNLIMNTPSGWLGGTILLSCMTLRRRSHGASRIHTVRRSPVPGIDSGLGAERSFARY